MKISISTPNFDPQGLLILSYDQNSDSKQLTRRVSRTATMNGGCTFDDLGFSWSDVTLNLRFSNISEADEASLSYLVKNYGALNIVTSEGAFVAVVESFSFKEGQAELRLLIVEER